MATVSSGLAERYATALFDLADEAKALDQVAGDLKVIAALIAESPEFSRLINSPVLTRDEQGAGMAAVLDKGGAGDLTKKFVGVLAQNRRLDVLPRVIAAFLAELAHRRGEVLAEVTTATALSKAQLTRITDALKGALGAKVVVDQKVDAGLLGGLVVRVGSKLVDHSLKTKLVRLQLAMKGTV